MSIGIFSKTLKGFNQESGKDNDIIVRKINVPYFQRKYVWDEINWDISLKSADEILEKQYFMGTLILKRPNSHRDYFEIVDGQQRITTLAIFLKALCDHVGILPSQDLIINHIEHNKFDNESYHNIFKAKDVKSILTRKEYSANYSERDYEVSQITKCYDYFRMSFNEAYQESTGDEDESYISRETILKIADNFDKFTNNILFAIISLESDVDEQQIFDTLNSNAVSLTLAELLKNHLFNRENIEKYDKKWFNIFEHKDVSNYWEQDITTGRIRRQNIDFFLLSLFLCKEPKFIKHENLFRLYKSKNTENWIEEIAEKSESYKSKILPDIITRDFDTKKIQNFERLNILIFALQNTTIIPYLFYLSLSQNDIVEINKICKFLETYLIRRVVCGMITKGYNKMFIDFIAKNINTLDKLKSRMGEEDFRSPTKKIPDDETFRTEFVGNSYISNKNAKLVLYLLEMYILNKEESTHSVSIQAFNNFELEHIIPTKWQSGGWDKADVEIDNKDDVVGTIGNMTLLLKQVQTEDGDIKRLNPSISNKIWFYKREGIKNFVHDVRIFRNYKDMCNIESYLEQEKWTGQDTISRAEMLFDVHASKLWSL